MGERIIISENIISEDIIKKRKLYRLYNIGINIFVLVLFFISFLSALDVCPIGRSSTNIEIIHSRHPRNIPVGVYDGKINVLVLLEWVDSEGNKGPMPNRNVTMTITIEDRYAIYDFNTNFFSSVPAGSGSLTEAPAIYFMTDDNGKISFSIPMSEIYGGGSDVNPRKIIYSITSVYDPNDNGADSKIYYGAMKTETYSPAAYSPIAFASCFPLLLVAGLLLAAMYISGKDPVRYLDFSRFSFRVPRLSRRAIKGKTIGAAIMGAIGAKISKLGAKKREEKKKAKALAKAIKIDIKMDKEKREGVKGLKKLVKGVTGLAKGVTGSLGKRAGKIGKGIGKTPVAKRMEKIGKGIGKGVGIVEKGAKKVIWAPSELLRKTQLGSRGAKASSQEQLEKIAKGDKLTGREKVGKIAKYLALIEMFTGRTRTSAWSISSRTYVDLSSTLWAAMPGTMREIAALKKGEVSNVELYGLKEHITEDGIEKAVEKGIITRAEGKELMAKLNDPSKVVGKGWFLSKEEIGEKLAKKLGEAGLIKTLSPGAAAILIEGQAKDYKKNIIGPIKKQLKELNIPKEEKAKIMDALKKGTAKDLKDAINSLEDFKTIKTKDMIDGINAGIYKGAVLTDLSESYRELGEEKDNLERYDANISQLKALGAIENVPINNKDLESIEGTKKKLDQIEGQYEQKLDESNKNLDESKQKLDELNKEISETVKNLAPGATKPPEIIVKEAEIFDIKKQINDTKKKIGETKEQIVNLGEVRGDHVTYKTKSDYSTREIDKTLNKINNLTKETASWTVRDAMSANTNVETRAILGKEFHDKITYFTGTEKSLGMEEKKGGLTGTIEGDIGVIFATVDGTMGPGADFYVEAIKQIANEERVNIIREAEQWTKDRKTLEGPRPPLGFRTETGEEKAEKRNKAAADLVRLTREHGWTKPSDISKQIADMEKHRVFDESGKFIEDSRKSEEKGLEKSIKAIAGGIDNEGLRKKILDQSEIGARYIESEGRGHDNGSMGGAGEFYKGISGEFLGYKSDSEDSGALLKALVSGGDLPKQPYNHTNKKTGEMVIRYKDSNEIDKKLTAMKIALIRNGVGFKGSEGSIILPNIGESEIKIYKEGNKLMARKLGVRKK